MSSPYSARLAGITIPTRIRGLLVHPELRLPIPWFCQQDPPDFRVVRPNGFAIAHHHKLCWICGEKRYEKRMCFVVGPMCVVTGTSSELPSHTECARFAAQACPFLANPRMRRNEKNLPTDAKAPPGQMIARNPGVTAILSTDRYEIFGDGRGGTLIEMGPPRSVLWFREGREATRAEVEHSIATGMPTLEQMAALDGDEGTAALAARRLAVNRWLPKPGPVAAAAAPAEAIAA
jgi:hypothetical protein